MSGKDLFFLGGVPNIPCLTYIPSRNISLERVITLLMRCHKYTKLNSKSSSLSHFLIFFYNSAECRISILQSPFYRVH